MATIKQIAKLAGVSATTVSNVLNGNTARMSPLTREKVETILREQDYAPNMAAHILGQNRSRIIGVIMFMEPRRNETVLEDPFSSLLIGAIEAELRQQGYYMMVHTTGDEDEVLRVSRVWKLAGLILVWVPSHTIRALIDGVSSPLVLVDSVYDGKDKTCRCINLEDQRGTLEMGRYLVSMGHHRFTFLANENISYGIDRDRLHGLEEALKEHGYPKENIRGLVVLKDRDDRFKMYKELAHPSSMCTVLVFCSDYHASEAISYFQEIGVRVPEDISVTGFDDNVFSRIVQPRLTTVHQDVGVKGRVAVDTLLAMIRGNPVSDSVVRLPARLVVRDSVGRV